MVLEDESGTVVAHGGTMWFDEVGPRDANSIVFLHGAGTSSWMWQRQVADLSPRYHCLVPDLPGHGQSNRIPWRNLDHVVGEVKRLIAQRAHGGHAHLVGLSLGGHVALRLAEMRPENVDHVVLSGINVLPFPHSQLTKFRWYLLIPFRGLDFVLRGTARQLRIPDEAYGGYREAARQTSWQAMLQIGNEILDRGMSALPCGVTCSTLVVAGSREHPLVQQSIPLVIGAIPGARGYRVPGVGHGWNGEAPGLFSQMVRAWIEDGDLPTELESVSIEHGIRVQQAA